MVHGWFVFITMGDNTRFCESALLDLDLRGKDTKWGLTWSAESDSATPGQHKHCSEKCDRFGPIKWAWRTSLCILTSYIVEVLLGLTFVLTDWRHSLVRRRVTHIGFVWQVSWTTVDLIDTTQFGVLYSGQTRSVLVCMKRNKVDCLVNSRCRTGGIHFYL